MKIKIPKLLIEIKPSKITPGGVGIFAATNIKKGAKITKGTRLKDFSKNFVSWKEFKNYPKDIRPKIKDLCIETPQGFLIYKGLDFNELPISWYINHSCDGNIIFNKNGDYIARRNIKKGEELTYDYALLSSGNRVFIRRCLCQSKNCRKIIKGNDWKNKKFQEKNYHYLHPYLKNQIKLSDFYLFNIHKQRRGRKK